MWRITSTLILFFLSTTLWAQEPDELQREIQELNKTYCLDNRPECVAKRKKESEEQMKVWKERRARSPLLKAYIERASHKIEDVGNKSYPDALINRFFGDVLIYIEIKSSGELSNASIKKSSGHIELDNAAVIAVQSSAPFDKFPDELTNGHYDIIGFTKNFSYVQQLR